MKRVLTYAAIAASLAMTGSSAIGYDVEPVYNYYYYSDSGHQNPVGFARGTCEYYDGAGYELEWGTYSSHYDQELIAYCDQGVWLPL